MSSAQVRGADARRSGDRVAQPDPDRGDIHGALIDAFSLAVAGGDGAELAELVETALYGVAFLVGSAVECGRPTAGGAEFLSVGGLVLLEGMTVLIPRRRR